MLLCGLVLLGGRLLINHPVTVEVIDELVWLRATSAGWSRPTGRPATGR